MTDDENHSHGKPVPMFVAAANGMVLMRFSQKVCCLDFSPEVAAALVKGMIDAIEVARAQRLVMEANAEHEVNQMLRKAGFKPKTPVDK